MQPSILAAKAPENVDVTQGGSPSPPAGLLTPSPLAPLNPVIVIATNSLTLKRKLVEEAGAEEAPPYKCQCQEGESSEGASDGGNIYDGLGLEAAMRVLEDHISARITAEIVTLVQEHLAQLKHLNDTIWTPYPKSSEVWYRKATSSREHVLLTPELAPMPAEEERGLVAALGAGKGKEKAAAEAVEPITLIDCKLDEKLAPFMALMRKFQQGEK
ncbi:hypothetical protein OF83DRAFT_1179732 [Amylostereum chailletii]|nr:hypothetical protein OF83DRAFT_1179732 [Amylostereum chailletii]